MTLQPKYLEILSALLPNGAVGASLLLGSAAMATARPEPDWLQPRAADEARVSHRLTSIRGAVSEFAGSHYPARNAARQLAWWGY